MTWLTKPVLGHLGYGGPCFPRSQRETASSWGELVICLSGGSQSLPRGPQNKRILLQGLALKDPWSGCQRGSDPRQVTLCMGALLETGICSANPQPMIVGVAPYVLTDACPQPKAIVSMLP